MKGGKWHPHPPLYTVRGPPKDGRAPLVVTFDSGRRGRRPTATASDEQLVLTQRMRVKNLDDWVDFQLDQATTFLSHAFERIHFVDPIPSLMRGYAFRIETALKSDAANLSAVLHRLCVDERKKDAILEFIGPVPERDVIDIDFLETERNEVMVVLAETFGAAERRVDAGLLSDGTLRVLAVAAAMHSVPELSTLIIEEIDNGVHPTRSAHLLANIHRIANKRRLKVVLTTHNPALLDSLPDAALPSVHACYRQPDEGDSRIVRIGDVDRYPELVAQGRLGDLMSKGILDRALKESPADRARRQKIAEEWINSLRNADS